MRAVEELERGEKRRQLKGASLSRGTVGEKLVLTAELVCFTVLFRIDVPQVPKVFWRKGDKHSNSSDKIRMRKGVAQCADPWADPTP